ncbi:hypothetical protein C8R48DRAFT_769855 [Suillus tomentosus]|nr:hypothetical protein C8R48DRAFT_769855 [Suillus tomentosus]
MASIPACRRERGDPQLKAKRPLPHSAGDGTWEQKPPQSQMASIPACRWERGDPQLKAKRPVPPVQEMGLGSRSPHRARWPQSRRAGGSEEILSSRPKGLYRQCRRWDLGAEAPTEPDGLDPSDYEHLMASTMIVYSIEETQLIASWGPMDIDHEDEGGSTHLERMEVLDEGEVSVTGNGAQPEHIIIDEDPVDRGDAMILYIQEEYIIVDKDQVDGEDAMEVCDHPEDNFVHEDEVNGTWEYMIVGEDQADGDVMEICAHSEYMEIDT